MNNSTFCIVSIQGIGVDDDAVFLMPNELADVDMPVYLDLTRPDQFSLESPKLYDCLVDVYVNGYQRPKVQKLSESGYLPKDIVITRFIKITNYG